MEFRRELRSNVFCERYWLTVDINLRDYGSVLIFHRCGTETPGGSRIYGRTVGRLKEFLANHEWGLLYRWKFRYAQLLRM